MLDRDIINEHTELVFDLFVNVLTLHTFYLFCVGLVDKFIDKKWTRTLLIILRDHTQQSQFPFVVCPLNRSRLLQ